MFLPAHTYTSPGHIWIQPCASTAMTVCLQAQLIAPLPVSPPPAARSCGPGSRIQNQEWDAHVGRQRHPRQQLSGLGRRPEPQCVTVVLDPGSRHQGSYLSRK
eukprot:282822-Chlamydomonas_euryale.AAC.9